MDIVFLTPTVDEGTPLGHLSTAVPKVLRSHGHGAIVVSPLFSTIDPTARSLARRLTKLEVTVGGKGYACTLYDGRTPRGVQLLFVGHDDLFGRVTSLGSDPADPGTQERALVFAKAARELLLALDRPVDAVHAFDWPGAVGLVALHGTPWKSTPRWILTLDEASPNPKVDWSALGVEPGSSAAGAVEAAVAVAHHVTLPSVGLARRIAADGGRTDVHRLLAAAGPKFRGVPVGIDPGIWNPATDPVPASRFDPLDLAGKGACRRELQSRFGLATSSAAPLLGAVVGPTVTPRLTRWIATLPELLRNDCQLAVLARGGAPSVAELEALSGQWPDRLRVLRDDGQELLHHLVAGADLFVVTQAAATETVHLLAMRYGALPIAPATDGFDEDIIDIDAHLLTGTGFLYVDDSEAGLLGAQRRALGAHAIRESFPRRTSAAMRVDHTWERSARIFEGLYRDTQGTVTAAAPASP